MNMLSGDLRVLYHLVLRPIRGNDHASRIESLYAGQADAYDDFRHRLLPGRQEIYSALPVPVGGVWVDLGGGTGAGLEWIGPSIRTIGRIYLVDLSPSLLAVARQRVARHAWNNVQVVEADATKSCLSAGCADVVTFSYALTMIPDWFSALENAARMLRPGGHIGAVDFYVSRKHTAAGTIRHSWLTRTFWPLWFAADNVFLSPDHLPYLQQRFDTVRISEGRGKIPYFPLGRVPYYGFIGQKRTQSR
jgi:S-adenosylmethionine-diacylgycerolhomoserine-N-methlytransferase